VNSRRTERCPKPEQLYRARRIAPEPRFTIGLFGLTHVRAQRQYDFGFKGAVRMVEDGDAKIGSKN
jgi:hypothetical protein